MNCATKLCIYCAIFLHSRIFFGIKSHFSEQSRFFMLHVPPAWVTLESHSCLIKTLMDFTSRQA